MLRYVDHDPGPGMRDYMCGGLTGDGHKGTDIAIRDLATMAAGVEVRAAAAGVVDALRDGMADLSVNEAGRQAIEGKECGNGIRLAHGDGWTTWYCHLRRGSLMVRQGDRVEAGQPLALVGLSGETSFPHVHFDVRHGERVVDPFVGAEPAADCGPGRQPMWASDVMDQLAYQPVLLTDAGFATAAPDKEDVRRGWHRLAALPVASPALVLWVEGFWVAPGDRVTFRLRGPDGGTRRPRHEDRPGPAAVARLCRRAAPGISLAGRHLRGRGGARARNGRRTAARHSRTPGPTARAIVRGPSWRTREVLSRARSAPRPGAPACCRE